MGSRAAARRRLRWLAELPFSASLDGVLYCHATPQDDTSDHDRRPRRTTCSQATFGGVEERVVVIGHTHHQFERRDGDVRVVNAGSVGMPYEGEVAAFWRAVEDGEPSFRQDGVRRRARRRRHPRERLAGAEEFVTENLSWRIPREEANAYFESQRT